MNTLRAGVIGLAITYSKGFARQLRQIPGVELVAAADLGRDDAYVQRCLGMSKAQYADDYGVRLYEDPAAMIQSEELEVVAVAPETGENGHVAAVAGGAGARAIFVAKPFAHTLAAADEALAAAARAGAVIGVASPARQNGHLLAAKAAIDAGRIGDLLTVRAWAQHNAWPPDRLSRDHWTGRPDENEEAGSSDTSVSFYVTDAALWLFDGLAPERLTGDYANLATPYSPYPDNGTASVRFAGGRLASLQMYFSMRWKAPGFGFELVGSQGTITGQTPTPGAVCYTAAGAEALVPIEPVPEIEAFVTAYRAGQPPPLPGAAARRALELCMAWRRSSRTGGRPVALPLAAP